MVSFIDSCFVVSFGYALGEQSSRNCQCGVAAGVIYKRKAAGAEGILPVFTSSI